MPLMHQRIPGILDEKLALKVSFQSSYDDVVASPHNTQYNAICAICDGWSCAVTYIARCHWCMFWLLRTYSFCLFWLAFFNIHQHIYTTLTSTYIQHLPPHETTIAVQVAQVQVEYLRQWLEGKTPPPQPPLTRSGQAHASLEFLMQQSIQLV